MAGPHGGTGVGSRLTGAVGRRARSGAFRRSLFQRPDRVKVYGVKNVRDRVHWYRTVDTFVDDVRGARPSRVAQPRYLVGLNHLDREFVEFTGPKVFATLEPPMVMTDETVRLVESGQVDAFHYRYDDPDPDRRMHYPCLPVDRSTLVRDLGASLHVRRPGLCCIVARYARNDAPESLHGERIAVVDAFGPDIDIYGRAPHQGPNGWLTRPTYRGPAAHKIDTLRGYDFALVYESCDVPGYITEKLFDALAAGAIPLHRGGAGFLADILPSACYVDCTELAPAQVHETVRSMPRDEIVHRREAGRRFLASADADRFTHHHWRTQLADRLRAQAAGQ